MFRSEPLAYLLTWTCYGTWLHGDERGSVDDEHNIYGTPHLAPDTPRVGRECAQLKHPPVTLDAAGRAIVESTIEAHCRIRRWELRAMNARSNHVHVVVTAVDTNPDGVMDQFKAWCTRRLREAGLMPHEHGVWTQAGSKRYLWDEGSVNYAVRYVMEGQGPDLPGASR